MGGVCGGVGAEVIDSDVDVDETTELILLVDFFLFRLVAFESTFTMVSLFVTLFYNQVLDMFMIHQCCSSSRLVMLS